MVTSDLHPVDWVIWKLSMVLDHGMGLFVHQSIAALEWHVFIELIDYRHSVWNFILFDVFVTDILYVLEECSQSVFMGNNHNIFTVLSLLTDLIVPKWDHTVDCTLEGLNFGKSVSVYILVFFVIWRMPIVVICKTWWTLVVGISPLVELLLRNGFGL